MKFLFYHHSMQTGGIERTISLLSHYLTMCGHEIAIVTMDDKPSFYSIHSKVRYVALNTARVSTGKADAIKNNFFAIQAVKKELKFFRPDMVVCFQPNTLLFSWLARGGMSCRIIGSEPANPYHWNEGFWNRAKKWIALCADGYMFQTAGAQSYYRPKTRKNSFVISNILESEQFIEAELPWDERKNLCAVGRLIDGKRFDDLLRAISLVAKKYPDVHLNLYGDGPARKKLEALCAELGLQNTVRFCGRNNQIVGEYAKHKIFVMTSESEGLPNVLIEAMASGCACVSTNCDFGPAELIQDGKNGFLVPVHDVDAIADRVCKLLEDDALSKQFGENAKSIREKNCPEQVGKQFLDYVNDLYKK